MRTVLRPILQTTNYQRCINSVYCNILSTMPLLHKRSFDERFLGLVRPDDTGKTSILIHIIGSMMNTESCSSCLIDADKRECDFQNTAKRKSQRSPQMQ